MPDTEIQTIAADEAGPMPVAIIDPSAEAAAQAAAVHRQAIDALAAAENALGGKLADMMAVLKASIAKAAADPGHLAYAQAFARDLDLLADEKIAWMLRHT